MSWRRSWVVARHEARILRRDPTYLIVFTLMPLLIMAFFKPIFRSSLLVDGVPGANGAEQAVPGTAVMFAFFMVGNVGFAVFREHGWGTWDRLRASWATPADIMVGKSVVPVVAVGAQLAVLFGLGIVLFDLDVRGAPLALVLVAAGLAVALVAFGLALMAVCRTIMQLNAFANLGGVVLAGLGGCLTPVDDLPRWAQHIAPASPAYWAMRGFRSVILDGGGVGEVLLPIAVLAGFSAGFVAVALTRFRFEETKISWA